MSLHDAIGINCKKAQLLKIKAQVSSIWAKGCILMIVCALSDLTWLPLFRGGRKSWYIIIGLSSGQVDDFTFFDCSSQFFLLVEFHCSFSNS